MTTRCLKCNKYLFRQTEHCPYCHALRNIPKEEENERRTLLTLLSKVTITTIIMIIGTASYIADPLPEKEEDLYTIIATATLAIGITIASVLVRHESTIIINHSGYTRQEKNAALKHAIISSMTAWALILLIFLVSAVQKILSSFQSS